MILLILSNLIKSQLNTNRYSNMLTYSEIFFFSIEGEAKYAGHPTIYLRLTGCNKTCAGFNNPTNVNPGSLSVLGFDPKQIKVIQDVPEISIGCDSIYSWDPQFEHLWKTQTADQIIDELEKLLPVGGWTHPKSHQNVIFSITGGEPLMNQKTLPELLLHPRMKGCKHILFETNGSVALSPKFQQTLKEWWQIDPYDRKITFSNSPKLSASGETWKSSIKPKAIYSQRMEFPNVELYLKFVCDAKDEHFDEVYKALDEYHNNGIPLNTPVYIMPMACTEGQQENIAKNVALMCMQYGFIYAHRIHCTVFSNAMGT